MGKPLSRPGCFRKSSCCLEKHGAGDGGVGGRVGGVDGGYGDGYVPQRSIYDTMCINQQIDSHHHHPGGSIRRDFGGEGSFSYSTSGSLRVSRSPADMFDPQTRSLTPNPSFVRRLDERAIYDSLKLAGQGTDGDGCHSPGCFTRSVSPSVSSFSAPGVASSSKKHHHYHHHYHGDSTKSRDGRHSWKVLTPPKHLESLELTPNEMMDRGGGYLNPGHYPPPGGQSSSVTSPLISPFSGSPLSSGYHTPVFFSPAKPRPSQTQSLRCSPPQVIQPRHYSQTQSLRLSPPHELRRSPYRAQLVQLSAHDLEQDLRERGGGWGRNEREREWEREREREMERGWAQREWERERERGRLERERARERERRETSTFGTFGYGRPVPLRSDRDSVFLESEQLLDTTPLLLPQPSPSPSPSAAPRMGTSAVGRNRAGLKVGPDSIGGSMMSKFDNGSVGLVLVDSKSGCGPRLISEVGVGNMSEAEIRAGIQEHHRAESWNKYNNGSRVSIKNGSEMRMGSQVKTRPGGRDLEGRVQSGVENMAPAVNKDGHRGGIRSGGKNERVLAKPECNAETIPTTVTDFENKNVPGDKFEIESGCYQGMKPETEAGVEAKAGFRQMENRSGIEAGIEAIVNNDVYSATESSEETKVETEIKTNPVSEPEGGLEGEVETGTKGNTETDGVGESHNNNVTMARAEMSVVVGDKTDTVPADQAEKKTLDIDRIESSHVEKGSRTQKSKSSKSSSRTRPGTATGIRPGAVSPRLNRGLGDLESTGPTEGIESTWPRRIMVRKRTVRQGGALHNLPILPPLPSVLSALEKRFPHALLHSRPAHFSENPLTNLTNATSIVGRCSLKEPSHPETGQGGSVVGRASLKEQNLEHWRVWREHEEPRKSKTKEKQRQQNKEKTEREERKRKEEKRERETREEKDKREKEGVTVIEGLVQESKQGKSERMIEGKMQMDGNKKKGLKKEQDVEIKRDNMEDRRKKMKDGIQEQHGQELEEVVVKFETEEGEVEGGEGGTFGEEAGMQSWDAVLEMVTTLWDDGWEKGEAEAGGDTDSLSGSLQRWPLLRPPVGFGGSHPPSSAASELSLTELERRARELDSDLEHLDLSQPHKDTQDLYPTLMEPQRERADMYQTHPGPQREKAALLTGVGSRSQVSLELSAMVSPASDTDRPPVDWSATPGTSTAGTSSNKEDSSPDSNLTLESDSSGVFLSLSNQSQEEAGSDSDQPISGSDLGSSSTSLEKDGEDVGLKEWGREESAELQWCYPSLLNTSLREDIDGDGKMEREESRHGKMGGDEETGKDESGRRVGKIGMVSIIRTPPDHTDIKDSMTPFTPQSEEMPPRKKVTLMGGDSPFPLSPFQQPIKHLLDPNQKPIRSSGLDCGDIDPFVQSDSFVYLAVSARPASQGEVTTMKEVPTHNTKHESAQQYSDGMKTQLDQSSTRPDARPNHLVPQKPEEGDFLCTDSFVYLAAPACLLLGPAGTTPYSGRESDSESSGSGPVDVSVLGCGSLAGDSDWDSDLSDSDPSHPSRISATGNKSAGVAQSKHPPAELGWDLFGETTEPEVLSELFMEQDRNNNGKARKVSELTTSMAATQAIPMETKPVTTPVTTTVEQPSTTKKVTWQFKPPQRSVCTGSRKEKEKEVTSASLVRLGGGETHRPSSSSSSSSSSSPSSSSSG